MPRWIEEDVSDWPANPFARLDLEFVFRRGPKCPWPTQSYASLEVAAQVLLPPGWNWETARAAWNALGGEWLAENPDEQDCWALEHWGNPAEFSRRKAI